MTEQTSPIDALAMAIADFLEDDTPDMELVFRLVERRKALKAAAEAEEAALLKWAEERLANRERR